MPESAVAGITSFLAYGLVAGFSGMFAFAGTSAGVCDEPYAELQGEYACPQPLIPSYHTFSHLSSTFGAKPTIITIIHHI